MLLILDARKFILKNLRITVSFMCALCSPWTVASHYGAPLVKGVLTSSGRLTCPW